MKKAFVTEQNFELLSITLNGKKITVCFLDLNEQNFDKEIKIKSEDPPEEELTAAINSFKPHMLKLYGLDKQTNCSITAIKVTQNRNIQMEGSMSNYKKSLPLKTPVVLLQDDIEEYPEKDELYSLLATLEKEAWEYSCNNKTLQKKLALT